MSELVWIFVVCAFVVVVFVTLAFGGRLVVKFENGKMCVRVDPRKPK